MLTSNFKSYALPGRGGFMLSHVGGKEIPDDSPLKKLRIPPAWTDVQVETDPQAHMLVTGKDAAGRAQRLYSPQHVASASSKKFQRVKDLLAEWDDIRTQIESDLNNDDLPWKEYEAALVAYTIYETGARPGFGADELAEKHSYGIGTVQLRHVKPSPRGCRLKFIGKKGVEQNILVTNPFLSNLMLYRKRETNNFKLRVFVTNGTALNAYFKKLGSGAYTPKDFRTARGTKLALELLGSRTRLPKTKAGRKKIVNDALDRVAKLLGNTRAISKKSYVDPEIIERLLPGGK